MCPCHASLAASQMSYFSGLTARSVVIHALPVLQKTFVFWCLLYVNYMYTLITLMDITCHFLSE